MKKNRIPPADVQSFLSSTWVVLFNGAARKPWQLLFSVIAWYLWKCRNQIAFQGGVLSLIHFRFVSWYKARWLEISKCFSHMPRFPKLCTAPRAISLHVKRPELTFNVNGSALGKPGPAGIGGVLRDEHGRMKALFSKSIGVSDSNCAEFLALREAFIIFAASSWHGSHFLVIESESKDVVQWLTRMEPWFLRPFADHIETLSSRIKGWRCTHIPREANLVAHQLAKESIGKLHDMVVYHD